VTSADNNASFTLRVSNSASTVTSPAAVLTVTPYVIQEKHRYTFNETEGTAVADSVGAANGEAIGGVTLGGGEATLNGVDGYINLPNGIVSELGADATIELWFTHDSPVIWSRIFDFGISAGGEDNPDNGVDFLFLTARNGDGFPRFIANFPSGGDLVVLDPEPPGWIPHLEQKYVAITWSSSKNISQLYYDGVLVRTQAAPEPLSNLTGRDVNNWLGRSQFVADAFWQGSYNELRLTSGAKTGDQIAAAFTAGPTPAGPVGPSIAVSKNGNNLTLSWPAAAATEGYILQSTQALQPGTPWGIVSGATQNGANMEVTVPMDQNMRFFRLVKP
jgi:arabinan endo-1,5-alpha-L-arabinosidase